MGKGLEQKFHMADFTMTNKVIKKGSNSLDIRGNSK